MKIFVFLYSEEMLTRAEHWAYKYGETDQAWDKKVNVFCLMSVNGSLGYADDGYRVWFVVVKVEIVYDSVNCSAYYATGA